MMGVPMYLTVDNLLARSEFYDHMTVVNLPGLKTRKITVEKKDVSWKEEIISSCTFRYSGIFLLISDLTVAVIPYVKLYFLLKSYSSNCEIIAVSQGVSVLLKFINLYQLEKYTGQVYFSDSRVFYQKHVVEINLEEQSQASIIATNLRLRNTLLQNLYQKSRRKYAFLVSKTEIERLQKSN